jgi:hypothetical protein
MIDAKEEYFNVDNLENKTAIIAMGTGRDLCVG